MINETVRQALIEAGMDFDTAKARFMDDDAILEKFLIKFLADPSFTELKGAVEARDLDLAFRGAHTLKGVAANFSFDRLSETASKQTELFRAGDLDGGIAVMPEVEAAYLAVASVIKEAFGQ